MKRLFLVQFLTICLLSTSNAQESIEEEIEQYLLTPCFHRIATKIYYRDEYNEHMELNEFFEIYENRIDMEVVEKSIRESVQALMDYRLPKEDRLTIYHLALDILCPR